jgi:multidrug efflux pump subunit AcrA (membrane-fusion protein)
MKKFVIWIVILFLVAFGGFRIIKKNIEHKDTGYIEEVRIPVVKVLPVTIGEVNDTISCIGTIDAQEKVTLMSKVPGKINAFLVKEKDIVKKGDVLVLIDRDIEGMKYKNSSIKSPIDGMVMKKFLDEGSQVEPSVNPLMRVPVVMVANLDSVKVLVNVSEKYLGRLKENSEADVKIDAYPDRVFHGKVVRIAPLVDVATRTAEVEIKISNKEHKLTPGMFARVAIIVEKKANAITVPIKAVLENNNHKFVFVVNGSRSLKREVQTGIYQKDFVEITHGLKANDFVIIEGNYGLKDNIKLETKMI